MTASVPRASPASTNRCLVSAVQRRRPLVELRVLEIVSHCALSRVVAAIRHEFRECVGEVHVSAAEEEPLVHDVLLQGELKSVVDGLSDRRLELTLPDQRVEAGKSSAEISRIGLRSGCGHRDSDRSRKPSQKSNTRIQTIHREVIDIGRRHCRNVTTHRIPHNRTRRQRLVQTGRRLFRMVLVIALSAAVGIPFASVYK